MVSPFDRFALKAKASISWWSWRQRIDSEDSANRKSSETRKFDERESSANRVVGMGGGGVNTHPNTHPNTHLQSWGVLTHVVTGCQHRGYGGGGVNVSGCGGGGRVFADFAGDAVAVGADGAGGVGSDGGDGIVGPPVFISAAWGAGNEYGEVAVAVCGGVWMRGTGHVSRVGGGAASRADDVWASTGRGTAAGPGLCGGRPPRGERWRVGGGRWRLRWREVLTDDDSHD